MDRCHVHLFKQFQVSTIQRCVCVSEMNVFWREVWESASKLKSTKALWTFWVKLVAKCKQTLYQHGLKNNLKSQITICKYIQGCLLLEKEINYKCLTLTITVIIFGGERLRASEDHLSLRTFLKNNAFFKLLIFKKVIKCLYLALIIARNRNLKTVVILYSIKQQKLDRINIRQWEKHVFLYSVSLL